MIASEATRTMKTIMSMASLMESGKDGDEYSWVPRCTWWIITRTASMAFKTTISMASAIEAGEYGNQYR